MDAWKPTCFPLGLILHSATHLPDEDPLLSGCGSLQAYWTPRLPRAFLFPEISHFLLLLHCIRRAPGTRYSAAGSISRWRNWVLEKAWWTLEVFSLIVCCFVLWISLLPKKGFFLEKPPFYTFPAFMVPERSIPLLCYRGQQTIQEAWPVLFPVFSNWFRRWVCDSSQVKVSFSGFVREVLGKRFYLSTVLESQ